MKTKSSIILFFFFCLLNICKADTNDSSQKKAEAVLSLVLSKLNSLKSIRYDHKRIVDLQTALIYSEFSGKITMDFSNNTNSLGMNFYFDCADKYMVGYNGSVTYTCEKADKTIEIENDPMRSDFETFSCLNPSVYSVKNAIPWLLNDSIQKSVRDTIIKSVSYYNVVFSLKDNELAALGNKSPMLNGISFTYSFIIDKKTLLPFQVLRRSFVPDGNIVSTEFSNIETDIAVDSSLFSGSKFTAEFKPLIKKRNMEAVKVNELSQNFALPAINKEESIVLKNLQGNVVMLDFWFIGCGPCIASIPWMIDFNKRMSGKPFRLLSINTMDSQELIKIFLKRKPEINYDILYNSKNVTLQYGIYGCPSVILIDKNGKVIYKGSVDEKQIEEMVQKNL